MATLLWGGGLTSAVPVQFRVPSQSSGFLFCFSRGPSCNPQWETYLFLTVVIVTESQGTGSSSWLTWRKNSFTDILKTKSAL